jgi:hypothetical protein
VSDQNLPVQAPSPALREAVITQLSRAFAAGLIEVDELERRTEVAVRALTREELGTALAGLEAAPAASSLPARNPAEFAVDHPRRHPSRMTVAVMSGVDRKGRWTPARRHFAIALMGGAFLDFREAQLPEGVTHVHLFTMWGGIEVAVPPGLDVEVSGAALMGGLERIEQESGSTDPRRPRLHVHAFALMGGIEVRALAPGMEWKDQEAGEA